LSAMTVRCKAHQISSRLSIRMYRTYYTYSYAISPVHTYALPGTYLVCLTAYSHCGQLDTCQTITFTAQNVNDNILETISVCPNPTKDFVLIKWNETGKYRIEMSDITGKLVQVYENVNAGELNVNTEKFEKGIYTIKLIDEQNQIKGTAKLIVK
jgi:hypothetical protein